MSELLQWMNEHFEIVFPLFIVWSLGWMMFFAWKRRRAGPLHPPIDQAAVRFVERYVSGTSDKNLFTRFGGAGNALVVTVLTDAILIEPVAIFKWLMPAGFNDLEHYVKRSAVQSVEPTTSLGRKTVRLTFIGKDGATRTLKLVFRKQDEFLAAVRAWNVAL